MYIKGNIVSELYWFLQSETIFETIFHELSLTGFSKEI